MNEETTDDAGQLTFTNNLFANQNVRSRQKDQEYGATDDSDNLPGNISLQNDA